MDRDTLYAVFWLHGNPIEQDRHKALKRAETLVPDNVAPEFVSGAYEANQTALNALQALNLPLQVSINTGMFF